jgi:hypothetical protein
LMGVEGGESNESDQEDKALSDAAAEKLKIAFRYEGMKQHADSIPQSDRSPFFSYFCPSFRY